MHKKSEDLFQRVKDDSWGKLPIELKVKKMSLTERLVDLDIRLTGTLS